MHDAFLEVDKLLEVLGRHRVEIVIVGGIAAVLAGSPVSTQDLDVVHSTSDENNRRLVAALQEINARYRDPAGRHIVPDLHRVETLRNHLLSTDFGRLDVMTTVGDGLGYSDLLSRAHEYDLGSIRVRAIDLETLIETKEYAGRPKDQYALLFLRELLDMSRSADD